MPETLRGDFLILEIWQWLTLTLIITFAFVIEKIVLFFLSKILNKSVTIIHETSNEHLEKAMRPLGKIAFLFFINSNLKAVGLLSETEKSMQSLLSIIMSCLAVWLGHRVVGLAAFYFTQMAKETTTKFDDILIPLLTKTTYVLVYLCGLILILNTLNFDVTGLIAGLGIGGLAFAFAAKDTLANFFGSLMLVLDRPFDVGDVVVCGDFEGVVEEVGFRSTRIRTFYDSVISISNGELMNRPIDNYGKRRYRRLNTTLGLEYDTAPEKIEAFCEGIRQLILNHKWTRKDNFHVYFTNFGASSLDIKLMVYWKTGDYARELAERHRLMIDILRLAEGMNVGFAFPTQTLHMFSEDKKALDSIPKSEYLKFGRDKGQALAADPVSLKNPRSNGSDDNQFGGNDVGL